MHAVPIASKDTDPAEDGIDGSGGCVSDGTIFHHGSVLHGTGLQISIVLPT